jgi:DNA-binding transcriptional LysR family regulator
MRGSDFAELKAFVAVVERQSFARAAEHLGLSPSALSQTIRQLESRIGARLLNRTTRSVAPSASGEQLYSRVAPLFREMANAVAEASDATGQISGTLRINTLGIAARTLIAPRLQRFHRTHPDVVLDIVLDDALLGDLCQSNRLTLTGAEWLQVDRNIRNRPRLEPSGAGSHPSADRFGSGMRLEFPSNGRGNQNAVEKNGQDVLQVDENEVVQRRRIGDRRHASPARSRSLRSCSRSSSA